MDLDSIARDCGISRGYLQTVPDTVIKPSPIHGQGLFTEIDLPRGAVLCRLDGQRVSIDQAPGVMDALEWNAVTQTEFLVRPIRTSYGYMNHSRTPNVQIDPESMDMVTLAAIQAGTELLIDYLEQPLPDAYLNSPHAEYLRQ